MTQTSELYQKLGGEEGIGKVVDYFYDLVLADESVNKFFSNTDMDKQRRHQTLFISFAVGGPNHYTGASMKKAHETMHLTDEHFDAIVNHLVAALKHFNVADEEIAIIGKTVEPLRKDIVQA